MFDFHQDRKKYFEIQYLNAKDYVIPFIENVFSIKKGFRVLEIGVGEGGVLRAFIEKGCTAVGVELDPRRVEWACGFLWEEIGRGSLHFVEKDIYKTDIEVDLKGKFDLILLKDVIEHYNTPDTFVKNSINRDSTMNTPLHLSETEKKRS